MACHGTGVLSGDRVTDLYQSSPKAVAESRAKSSQKVAQSTDTIIYQWTDSSGKTQFSDRPLKAARDVRRIDIPSINRVPPPPVHPHAEAPLNPLADAPRAPPLSADQRRRSECNARLKQADDYEKSDQGKLAREIYPWIVANCPENRTGRIGGRIRLVPAPEPGVLEAN